MNWFLRRLRPRHYLLLQTDGDVAAPHFMISLSLDDESEYVRYVDPAKPSSNSWSYDLIHCRTPEHFEKLEAAGNVAWVIRKQGLPALDIEFTFDELFADVGLFDDTDRALPSIDDYGKLS